MAIDKLKKHLGEVSEGMNKLKSSVEKPVTYAGAVGILGDVGAIKGLLDECENDTKNIRVSNSEADMILVIIQKIVPVIKAALSLVSQKMGDFVGLVPFVPNLINPARLLIKSQMDSLHMRALTLADSMINLSPTTEVSQKANRIRNEMDVRFKEVIRIYS